jgi:hypothetical protein
MGLSAALLSGVGLPLVARRVRAGGGTAASARSCILLYMAGGASHIDTFDPKPGRETGGEFKAIKSAVDGVRVSEHLPGLAARLDRMTLVRSLTTKEGNHDRARHLMHTGYTPGGGVDHPCVGSLVAADRAAGELPGYVAIGGPGEDAGFLGAGLGPFTVQDPTRPVRYLSHFKQVTEERFQGRLELWRSLEDDFARTHPSAVVDGQRQVGERAAAMMASSRVAAFALDDDPKRDAYGAGKFGAGCLMARRLVEAGVPFVEVTLNGWDTHQDNFATVKRLSGELDQGMSALLDDLQASGLLAETLVVWMGDFGRSPKINARGGRDHHPRASSVLLAGAGIAGGRVIGATDEDGAEVVERPVTVADLWRTIAVTLGLDPDRVRHTPAGRPIKTVDGGTLFLG